MRLTLVTARVVRKNERYAYKLVGKGERYLVKHKEGENAGDKVIQELTYDAEEPVIVVQTQLLKNNVEFIEDEKADRFFNAKVEYTELTDDGKREKKVKDRYIVQANTAKEAFNRLSAVINADDDCITTVAITNIIDVIQWLSQ